MKKVRKDIVKLFALHINAINSFTCILQELRIQRAINAVYILMTRTRTTKIFTFKLYGPFLWMTFNCLKATGPLRGDSLLFTTKSPGVPGTHLIDLGRTKG